MQSPRGENGEIVDWVLEIYNNKSKVVADIRNYKSKGDCDV
jgi:hypothetical protein